MISTQHIQAFVEAAKCLNFSTAANRLYITPSSLSKNIAQLEYSLGVQLFNRSNRVIALTPAGEYLCRYFETMLSDVEQQVEFAKALNAGKSGRLCLGLHAFSNLLPEVGDLLFRFSSAHPSIDYDYAHLYIQDVAEALLSERPTKPVDAVITKRFKLGSIPCKTKVIGSSRMAVAMRHGHSLLQKCERPTLKDMAGYKFITVSDAFSLQANDAFCEACERCGFTPDIEYINSTLVTVMIKAMSSDCIAIGSETDVVPYTALRSIPIEEIPKMDIVLAWNPGRVSYSLKCFLDFLERTEHAD